jgi:hypothetical protein
MHSVSDVPAVVHDRNQGGVVMSKPQLSMIAINPVIADRAGDFENWLRIVLVPAAREHRPGLLDRWEVLRAAKDENGLVIFTFLFYGGEAAEWQMEPILAQAPGADGARHALEDMSAMMKGKQYGWALTPVSLAS